MNHDRLPTVAVVVPTAGHRTAALERLISGVLSDPVCSEVIVVCDRTSPETEALITSLGDGRVRLLGAEAPVQPERDRGQAGRDVGFRVARAEVILSLDDDLEPEPGLASRHASLHADDEGLVVVGYSPVAPGEMDAGVSRAATELYAESYERACTGFLNGSAEVLLGLWGGHFSVRRTDWIRAEERAGVPEAGSARAAAHHIDTALGFRLREEGLEPRFEPSLVAIHRHSRRFDRIAADAHSFAYGRVCLSVAYPHLAPPPERELDARARWGPVRWVVGSVTARAVLIPALTRVSKLGSRLGLESLERGAARGLSLLGFAAGVRDARRDLDDIEVGDRARG